MPYLYENFDKHDNNGVVVIHSEDAMIIQWNYQHLMNIARANNPRPITKEMLRNELKAQLDMVVEDMWESYELCEETMLKEINKE